MVFLNTLSLIVLSQLTSVDSEIQKQYFLLQNKTYFLSDIESREDRIYYLLAADTEVATNVLNSIRFEDLTSNKTEELRDRYLVGEFGTSEYWNEVIADLEKHRLAMRDAATINIKQLADLQMLEKRLEVISIMLNIINIPINILGSLFISFKVEKSKVMATKII